jgi:hypothetical protein
MFPSEHRQVHQIGSQDTAALARLERARKLTFADDDVRGAVRDDERAGLLPESASPNRRN